MKSALRSLLMLIGLAAALPAPGAEIIFYEREGFAGGSVGAGQSVSNLADIGFNDRTASVLVRSGTWELCSDAYFRGRCVTVTPGEYATLRSIGLGNQLSSARELEWLGGAGGGRGGRVEMFDGSGFSGQVYVVTDAVTNFSDIGFNDRAQSLIVTGGAWEACEHSDFRGACQVYAPGRYANLGAFGGRISSIRLRGGGPVGGLGGGLGGGFVGGLPGGAWGTGSRAVLYEGPRLTGRAFVINNEVASNLASTGFNDRATSLRVEGGYWVFCSDANFGGECLTFGPGDYPTLPWGLAYKISSGRRIHGQYPYSQNPKWQR